MGLDERGTVGVKRCGSGMSMAVRSLTVLFPAKDNGMTPTGGVDELG